MILPSLTPHTILHKLSRVCEVWSAKVLVANCHNQPQNLKWFGSFLRVSNASRSTKRNMRKGTHEGSLIRATKHFELEFITM